jgi:hypothetical protein
MCDYKSQSHYRSRFVLRSEYLDDCGLARVVVRLPGEIDLHLNFATNTPTIRAHCMEGQKQTAKMLRRSVAQIRTNIRVP